MVKHIQTLRRQVADELTVFDHSVGLTLKWLIYYLLVCFAYQIPVYFYLVSVII